MIQLHMGMHCSVEQLWNKKKKKKENERYC